MKFFALITILSINSATLDKFEGLSQEELSALFLVEQPYREALFNNAENSKEIHGACRQLTRNEPDHFLSIQMIFEYWHSDKLMTSYLKEDTRKECKLETREGRLFFPNGKVVNSSKKQMYVMDPTGQLYICPKSVYESRNMYHSSFLAGSPVISAGNVIVQDGVITSLDGESGHYRPTPRNVDLARALLIRAGVMRTTETFSP